MEGTNTGLLLQNKALRMSYDYIAYLNKYSTKATSDNSRHIYENFSSLDRIIE